MPPADRRLFPDWNEPRPRACAWGPPPGRLRRWLEPPSSRAQSRPTRQASPRRLTGFPPLGFRSGWRQVYATQGAAACEQVVVARPASQPATAVPRQLHTDTGMPSRQNASSVCVQPHTHTSALCPARQPARSAVALDTASDNRQPGPAHGKTDSERVGAGSRDDCRHGDRWRSIVAPPDL